MAVAAAAALLDELMGRSRNDGSAVKKKKVKWEDPEYCQYYMVKFCPHDLFVNTKADLGPCTKLHCEEAKGQFSEAEDTFMKLQYEEDFVRFAQGMLNEVERKIIKGEQRLALMGKSEPPPQLSSAQTQKNEEQITLLSEKINNLVSEAEQMGIQGNVEQAQGLMKLCDKLKEERETLVRQNENSHWSATVELAVAQEKQMEVCKVCGAFLIVGDAQSRIDDHLMGKQHTGYGRLKNAVDEITKKHENIKQDRLRKREEERNKRFGDRDDKRRDNDRSRRINRSRNLSTFYIRDPNTTVTHCNEKLGTGTGIMLPVSFVYDYEKSRKRPNPRTRS
ncbi:luc7-like protein 3 isoform X2 [Planococcus citri]|uniref:luc7-like protein 3 isoform X2 n=1 Tax=Planococcus citri TaxID=170843 RepID=UPI0031F764A5